MVANEEGVIERIIIFMMPPETNVKKEGNDRLGGPGGGEVRGKVA